MKCNRHTFRLTFNSIRYTIFRCNTLQLKKYSTLIQSLKYTYLEKLSLNSRFSIDNYVASFLKKKTIIFSLTQNATHDCRRNASAYSYIRFLQTLICYYLHFALYYFIAYFIKTSVKSNAIATTFIFVGFKLFFNCNVEMKVIP